MVQKSDIGFYGYASTQPHAVSSVSQLSGDAFSTKYNKITYNSFNSVAKAELSATQGGAVTNTYTLTYGPDNQRRISNSDGAETIYTGLYEVRSNGNKLHYIPTPDGLCGLIVTNGATQTNYYLHNDHLGSLIAAEAQDGTLTEFSYDPWGRRRSSTNWNDYNVTIPTLFTRGFTGHEHMDAYGLINMNGRVYDPRLGRMLSPDKLVQAPDYSQSYNRYTYCFNNPLMLTDPSGWEGEPLGYYDNGTPFWTTTDAYYYYEVNKRGFANGSDGMRSGYDFSPPDMWDDQYNMPGHYMGNGESLNNDQYADAQYDLIKSSNRMKLDYSYFLYDNGKSAYVILFLPDGSKVDTDGNIFNGNAQAGGGGPAYDGDAWFGTNFIGPGPDADPYTLPDPKNPGRFLQPIDAIDQAAQRHDYYYWKAGASGVKGAFFDKKVAAADAILANDAFNIIISYHNSGFDNVTGLPISNRTYGIALGVFYSFTPLSLNKFFNY